MRSGRDRARLPRLDRAPRGRRARRLPHRPREFWSLPLKVTPAVLVPRPETELLVEQALALLPAGPGRVLDLGTGQRRHRARPGGRAAGRAVVGVDVARAGAGGRARQRRGARPAPASTGAWAPGSPRCPDRALRYDRRPTRPTSCPRTIPRSCASAAEPGSALIGGPTGLEAARSIIAAGAVAPQARRMALGRARRRPGARGGSPARAAGLSGLRPFDDYSGRPARHAGPTPRGSEPVFTQSESTP